MKTIYKVSIVLCILLAIAILTSGVVAADIIEIRGPVYNGCDINDYIYP